MNPPTASRLGEWQVLNALVEKARTVASEPGLSFSVVNDTFALAPYRSALLLDTRRPQPRLVYASGLSAVDRKSPYGSWVEQVVAALLPALAERTHFSDTEVPAALQAGWREYWPTQIRMFRLLAHDGSVLAVVVYLSDQEWAPETEEKLSVLLQVYAGSLENLRLRERKLGALGRAADGSLSRGFKFSLLALGLTLAAMFIPVRQFVIAPAEIISLDSVAVTSPVEGIIASVPVRPNESVKAGDVLVKLDDTTIRNRLEGARQALEVARAEFLAGVHRSMITSDRGTEVGVLRGRINERLAEVAFLEEQLGLLDLRASRAGIAVYGQINDLIGKPVSPGQKVMELADPSRIGVQVWVPVADAINVRAGLRFNLMLYSDPLTARGATLEQTSYQAIRSPDGVAACRLRATLDTQEVLRLGLRGNAKIDGEPVALGYFLFRRPIVVIRQWLGI